MRFVHTFSAATNKPLTLRQHSDSEDKFLSSVADCSRTVCTSCCYPSTLHSCLGYLCMLGGLECLSKRSVRRAQVSTKTGFQCESKEHSFCQECLTTCGDKYLRVCVVQSRASILLSACLAAFRTTFLRMLDKSAPNGNGGAKYRAANDANLPDLQLGLGLGLGLG